MTSPPAFRDDVFVGSSAMAARMRAHDWTSTPVGPPETWPQSLRAMLRVLLTSRYAMWIGWGPELTFFYNDRYAADTLGAKHPWALGQPAGMVWREIWPAIAPRVERVLSTGEATWDSGLLLFLERSGYSEETYHTFSYSPLHDDDGAIGGMLCVVTEETARVVGERRVELLRTLASHLASTNAIEGVHSAVERTVAADGRSLPFAMIYELDARGERARLVSRSGIDADHPLARAEIEVERAPWPLAAIRDGAPLVLLDALPEGAAPWPRGAWSIPPTRAIALPIQAQGPGGPTSIFVAALNPHREVDDAYLGFVKLFVGQIAAGLSNARSHEEERRRAAALAELDRAKTLFFSNVSHELRTPLTLILGPIEELLGRELRAADREQLEVARRNARRLRKLVNTLLDFSRIEAGRSDASFRPTDVVSATRDLASQFRSGAERAGLTLVVECEAPIEEVHLDHEMWEKIVLNLLSNAFKFTFQGGVRVTMRSDGDAFELAVHDTGIGIAAEELPRIFDRFHRVDGARGRTHEGTGIGLALVRELVALHGGTVAAASEVGRGATFRVRIPLGAQHLPADRIAAAERARGSDAEVFAEESLRLLDDSMHDRGTREVCSDGARVLVVDDNPDMRDYLRHLAGDRWNVQTVRNGREALDAIAERMPDLVVTDVMMPELDGFGLVSAIRADPTTRELPVLMLSARAGEDARVEGLEAGVDAYLVKPFSARELVARMDSLLLRSRLRSVEEDHARRLSEVFERAPVGIAVLRGPDRVFEIANASYLELVGGRAVLGKPLREVLPEIEAQGLGAILDRVYETGEPFTARAYPVRLARDGVIEQRYFDLAYQPLFGARRAVTGIVSIGFEVTELVQARGAAESANRAKDEFLAMLGHELRNPMSPILTAIQLMRIRRVQGAEKERDVIERQVGHLVALVDDLLDVSRIARGRIEIRKQPMEIADVVATAIEQASPLLERHQHDLRVDVPARGLPADVDPGRMSQVIANLLMNAAKYTPPGGRIAVSAQREGGCVVLRVTDNGIGIEPEMLSRVFDVFTQAPQAIDRSWGGLGLGLAIVRSLVELHSGEVLASSAGRGRGAEFVVRIPALDPDDASVPPIAAVAIPAQVQRGARVIVVDDNVDSADMAAEALRVMGFDVRTAHDGPSALTLALAFRPSVAILDIGLPVMDGFELARAWRGESDIAETALVALTGYGQDHDRARALAVGFDVHLVKPVDPGTLSEVVDRLSRATPERRVAPSLPDQRIT